MTQENTDDAIEEPPDPRPQRLCVLYNGPEINGNPTFTIPFKRIRYDPHSSVVEINGRVSYLRPVPSRVLGLFEDKEAGYTPAGMFAEDIGVSIALSDLEDLTRFKISDLQKSLLETKRSLRLRDPHPSYR